MGSSPDIPAVQSPGYVAGQQQNYNTSTGTQNLVGSAANQTTPYGSTSYSFGTGPNGALQLTADQSLAPAQQALLDQLQGTQQTAGTAAGSLLSGANYGQAPDLTTDTNSIVNSNLNNYTNYLSPFFSQQSNNLDNQLRNQGILPGSDAYKNATNNQQQSQDQAVSGYLAQMEPQAFNQAVTSYQLPLQTASSLASLGSPTNYGSSNVNTPTANYQPVNYGQIAGQQGNLANTQYSQQANANNSFLSGIMGLGGTLGSSLLKALPAIAAV